MNDNEIKQIIENTFDEVSSEYDVNDYFLITAKEMVKSLNYKSNLNILDLSCGTGSVSIELASSFSNSKIEATDIASSMLKVAESKALQNGITNISFSKADVENLKYSKNSFDIITCGFALFFYTNLEISFSNFLSLLKENGVFVFSSFNKDAFAPYSDMFMDTLAKDYKLEYPKGGKNFLDTNEQIEELVSSAGDFKFEIQELQISKKITVEQWWELLNTAGYKGMLNQLSIEDLEKFKQEHLKDISKLCVDGKIDLRTNTLITKVYV